MIQKSVETIERHDMGSKKKMALSVKIWLAAVAVFGVMMGLFALSALSSGTEVVLRQGETAEFEVFRPFSTGGVEYSFGFQWGDDDSRRSAELGEWVTNTKDEAEWEAHRIQRFDNPGEPVHVIITLNGRSCRYLTEPVSTSGEKLWRDLGTPADSSGHAFHFGSNACWLREKAGWNQGSIRIEQVSPVLAGEHVKLQGSAPLNFKFTSGTAYDWLWMMYFWPFWLGILILWGFVLVSIHYHRRKQKTQLHPEA
ncbi:hypothetical protein H9Q10_00520 [Eikenella sp. S3360]|uniref:DUF2207 domain-containing protein n=1 Tax=Eikenella glucosivorans TaxID=2766967 RepID=A0ABS0N795_9NEIS|nr:hypothetical protein [Eikenella glucosivorans]MBH5328160.1 hypothetical protein [Eikenella glucosivorans]